MSYYDSFGWWRFDSNYFRTTTVLSTGKIIKHKAYNYLVYKTSTVYTGKYWPRTDTGFLYIREDTAAKRLYCWTQVMNVTYPNDEPLINYNLDVDDTLFYNYVSCVTVGSVDSILIAGQHCRRWIEKSTDGSSGFYQAYGVGRRVGVLPWGIFTGSAQVVGLDFYYKTDSVHLDFLH